MADEHVESLTRLNARYIQAAMHHLTGDGSRCVRGRLPSPGGRVFQS